MKTRTLAGLVIVALLVPLSACPRTPQVSLGVWIFEVDHTPSIISLIGVELGANGTLQTPAPLPPEATSGFLRLESWSQDGSTFTMMLTETGINDGVVYTGTVNSRRSIIEGIWTANAGESGTWSGMKL